MNEDLGTLLAEIKRLEQRIETALDRASADSAFTFPVDSIEYDDREQPRSHNGKVDLGGIALWEAAKHDISDMDMRAKYLPIEVCEGPGWNMLAYLLTSRIEHTSVSVTDTCSMARVPQTTALRYLELLAKLDLCQRLPDPADARRTWIGISDNGYSRMVGYYNERSEAHQKPLKFPTAQNTQ